MYDDLKKLVMSRKLTEAIQHVSDALLSGSHSDYLNTITIISSENSFLEQDMMAGIVRADDQSVRNARITSRFLGLLDQMKSDGIELAPKKGETPSDNDLCQHFTDLTKTLTEKLIFYKKDLILAVDPTHPFSIIKIY